MLSNVIVYVNNSPFSATLFVVMLSAVNAFVPVNGLFVGTKTHVFSPTHGSVGSVGTTGVLPSVVTTLTTLSPNDLYSVASDVTCNLYITVTICPAAIVLRV